MGMQDEYGNPFFAAHAMNGGAAGVTRGGADNRQRFVAFGQDVLEQVAEQLQGHILERQGDTMEQFQDMDTILADQGRHIRMTEGGIGAQNQLFQVTGRNVINIAGDDFKGKVRIWQRTPPFQIAG